MDNKEQRGKKALVYRENVRGSHPRILQRSPIIDERNKEHNAELKANAVHVCTLQTCQQEKNKGGTYVYACAYISKT